MNPNEIPQTFENHRRYVPGYHFLLSAILLVNLIIQSVRLFRSPSFLNGWGVVMAIAFGMMSWYLRDFPKRAQDRIIRMEERQRLGRLLPDRLRPRLGEFTPAQLVALRFASDEELAELAERVLNEQLKGKGEIKRLIRSWRADHLRV